MISVILKGSTHSSPKIQAILKVSSKFMNTNNDTVQIIASRIDFTFHTRGICTPYGPYNMRCTPRLNVIYFVKSKKE